LLPRSDFHPVIENRKRFTSRILVAGCGRRLAVFSSLRRRAGIPAANRQARCGAVSFVQRFGDALNLNVHFHTLALDGIYVVEEGGQVAFRPVPPPSDTEVARLTERVQRRIGKLLERRGLGPQADHDESDPLVRNEPLLAELYSTSISGRVATGPRAGRRLAKVGDEVDVENLAVSAGLRCATISGFSVHANVCVPAHDRVRLERLARYETRDATLFRAEATHNSDIAPREIG